MEELKHNEKTLAHVFFSIETTSICLQETQSSRQRLGSALISNPSLQSNADVFFSLCVGQELYNVNVMALNSTAVRIRFSLSNILVGLIGHAELHFTTDPTLPPGQWHVQKFSRPKRLFDSPNIEYVLNALKSNTTYFLQVKIKIDALQGGPESELFKLTMPPGNVYFL